MRTAMEIETVTLTSLHQLIKDKTKSKEVKSGQTVIVEGN